MPLRRPQRRRGDLNERLRRLVDERVSQGPGGAYEALQLLQSQVARSVAQKDLEKALATAKTGSLKLLEHGSVECAQPLALEYVKVLKTLEAPLGETLAQGVLEIAGAFQTSTEDGARDAEETLLSASVRWAGDRRFYARLAELALVSFDEDRENGDHAMPASLQDFVLHGCLAEEPLRIAEGLEKRVGGRDLDLAVTGATMRFVARCNLRDANALFDAVAAKKGLDMRRDWAGSCKRLSPLLCLVAFLLATCERNAGPLFSSFAARLSAEAQEVPHADALLAKIGQQYFGIMPPPSMMDMLSSMLRGSSGP